MGHWGHFFDHSLRKAEEAQGHDLMAARGDDQHSLQNATNATESGPADLIVYTQPTYGDKWKASATNLNMTHGWDTFIMVSQRVPPQLPQQQQNPAALYSSAQGQVRGRPTPLTALQHCVSLVQQPVAILCVCLLLTAVDPAWHN